MSDPIVWQQEPNYRQVVTKGELLRDIKTNIIHLLNDYKGRGIENEAFYTAEVEKLFTGGVVPSLIDWKILNAVLQELSEIKERGAMYQEFVKDVSDSLGVSDLMKIRDFIEYITTLAPVAPEVDVTIDEFPRYSVVNPYATFKNNIKEPHKTNQSNVYWEVQPPQGIPYARITLHDASSEDIATYTVNFSAGTYSRTYSFDGLEMGQLQTAMVNIPIDWQDWFGISIQNLTFRIEVIATDKRGNESVTQNNVIYPSTNGLPVGFETFQVEYLPTPNQGWRSLSGTIGANDRSFGPINMLDVDGNHRFRVRGYDPGVGWSPWELTPNYALRFRGDPPGKPNPSATTTINSATVTWKETANTDYYYIYVWQSRERIRRVDAGANLTTEITGLNQNTSYNFYVEAVNEWDVTVGSTTAVTKKKVKKTVKYNSLRHRTFNGQSYYNNSTGYSRPGWDGGWSNTVNGDQPHWEKAYSRTAGSMFQGHWRESSWGLGYAMRSGGYRAYDGQSHGNNTTFIEMNYSAMRNTLAGKKITKVEIQLRREGSSHGWADKGQPVYLYNHNSEFLPSDALAVYGWGRNKITNSNNPSTVTLNFKRNQSHKFSNNNIKKLVQNIVDGHMKGFAFMRYYGGTFNNSAGVPRAPTNYVRFVPKNFHVWVHYEDIV